MALTNGALVARRDFYDGGFDIKISFSGDNAYPAGGTPDFQAFLQSIIAAVAAAATDKNVRGPENVEIIEIIAGECGVLIPRYDKANDKLKVFDEALVENAVPDISGTTFNVTCMCK